MSKTTRGSVTSKGVKKHKNETKFPSLEEKAADALEVAAQKNEEREEKTAKKSIKFYFLIMNLEEKIEFLKKVRVGDRVEVWWTTSILGKEKYTMGYVAGITGCDVSIAPDRNTVVNAQPFALDEIHIGYKRIEKYNILEEDSLLLMKNKESQDGSKFYC